MSGAAEETEGSGAERPSQTFSALIGSAFIGFVDAFRSEIAAERDRWFLWLPVFLGAGIGLYFSLTVEPPIWIGFALGALAILAVAMARWGGRGVPAWLAAAAGAMRCAGRGCG